MPETRSIFLRLHSFCTAAKLLNLTYSQLYDECEEKLLTFINDDLLRVPLMRYISSQSPLPALEFGSRSYERASDA